jgi:hypothetical protein
LKFDELRNNISNRKPYRSDNVFPPLQIRHESMTAYSLQQHKKKSNYCQNPRRKKGLCDSMIQWRNIQCTKKDRIFSNQSLRKLVYDMTIPLNNEIMKLWKQKEELKLEIQTSLNLIQRIYFWQIYSDKITYFMILIWKKRKSFIGGIKSQWDD